MWHNIPIVSKMNCIQRIALLLLAWSFFASSLFSGNLAQGQDLTPLVRDFLKLTAYIILPQEESVLLKLKTEKDQAIFIENFWKQRDPTPGTPQNEYKDELIKRFHHVNRFFSRGTTREGWLTDRGRIYMILGEPASKHDFSGRPGIYPCEVWYYYGDKEKGLPVQFGLVFFKRKGSGELRLYDPVSDGISSLLMNTGNMAFDEYPALYERLQELVPDLAPVALSIIPGEIPMNFMPSPQQAILLADILESPKKDINTRYATHYLDYLGMVSTEYLTNYVDNSACVDILKDPLTDLVFLNFSIAPKTLSFDYFAPKDQHFCNLQLSVSLRRGETVVCQYVKDFPVYISPEEADRVRTNGISVEDSFPVIDGRYRLIVLLQNSVGKEFTVFETDVEIPAPEGRPHLVGLAVGYEFKEVGRDVQLPYKLREKKLLIDPARTFSLREGLSFFLSLSGIPDTVWEEGNVVITFTGSQPGQSALKTEIIPLNTQPFSRTLSYLKSISAGELPADYYVLAASLQDASGRTLDERSTPFIISPDEDIPHPIAQAKMVRAANPAPYFLMLADQSEKAGRDEKAEAWYERAFAVNPQGRRGLINYARFLLKVGKPEKSVSIVEAIKGEPALRFDYVLVRGLAAMAMGRTAEAIDHFLEGNKIYNSDTLLLNSLGTCYSRLGHKDKALAAWQASLRLNPEQDEIKKMVAEIEKKLVP